MELRKIVKFCQKNGILKFKSGDFEIELKEVAASRGKKAVTEKLLEPKDLFPPWESLTPEQRLLWSSPDLQQQGS